MTVAVEPAAAQLAEFAAGLRFEDIPADVVERAKHCVIDTVGNAAFSSALPWGKIAIEYAARTGGHGPCTILGTRRTTTAPMAALANGALTHSFELDSLRSPGVGAHPGATIAAPALAVAQEQRASGRDLIVAFVAGCEVLFRIGLAAKHSSEKLGFHAPGLTGPYASAIASGRLMGLDAAHLTHALGIAGSLSSGVLAFSKSRSGGMVKRLHLGRAAESGVLAACFAQDGFTGPPEILEGRFGFLDVYARDAAPERLTADLGTRWETRLLTFKRYACHVYAHTPVQAMLELRAQHGFAGSDVASVVVEGNEKLVSHHAGSKPGDLASAQYSVAFCVALAAFRDADDPRSFSADAVADPQIRALTRAVTCTPLAGSDGGYGSRVTVVLRSGTTYSKQLAAFKGMPAEPLTGADVDAKFRRLATPAFGAERADSILALLDQLEHLDDMHAVSFEPQ